MENKIISKFSRQISNVLIVLALAAVAVPAKDLGFTITVQPALVNGFIDPSVQDSAEDLAAALKRKGFDVILDLERADIRVIVTGRAEGSELMGNTTSVHRGIFGGLVATSTPIIGSKKYMAAQIQVGDAHVDYLSWGGLWKQAAGEMAKHIKKWAQLNREVIVGARGGRQAGVGSD